MRTPEQAAWDFVQQWLKKAQEDMDVCRVLLQSNLDSYDGIGFHAQQSAEKFLKALLVRHQIPFSKTHDVAELRKLVEKVDPQLADSLALVDVLTPYGVEFRYPGDFDPLSLDQARESLRLAEQARASVLAHLKPYLDAGRP